jgi:hypothetical protein
MSTMVRKPPEELLVDDELVLLPLPLVEPPEPEEVPAAAELVLLDVLLGI